MKYNQPYGVSDADASYINGDPSIGVAGSVPPAAAFENAQREIVAVIAAAGLTPSDTDLAQLLKALPKIVRGVYYGVDTGTADAMVVMLDPVPTAYVTGMVAVVKKAASANTGAMTINCNAIGSANLKDYVGAALATGVVPASGVLFMMYDGAQFRLVGSTSTVTNISSLAANSGDMIAVDGGTGVVDYRTARGTASGGVRAGGDRIPFGRSSDDHAMFDTRTDFIAWLNATLALSITHDATLTGAGTSGSPLGVTAAVRAWGTIRSNTLTAGSNIASIVATGGGFYSINFTTPMPDVNYAVITTDEMPGLAFGGWVSEVNNVLRSTTHCQVCAWGLMWGSPSSRDADFGFAIVR